MKYGAPKAEEFAVVTFVEKYRAYLGSAPLNLRMDNRAVILVEDVLDGPELYWSVDCQVRRLPHDNRAQDARQTPKC